MSCFSEEWLKIDTCQKLTIVSAAFNNGINKRRAANKENGESNDAADYR
jgi:hypothetical protein